MSTNTIYCLVLSGLIFSLHSLSGESMKKDAKIYVAGHNGLVGSAIIRNLQNQGFTNIITRTFKELDLRNQQAVEQFFAIQQPEFVFLAAAKVGGIKANFDYPADFIYDNLMIAANIIRAAYNNQVKKLLFLGSSCIYPRDCPQPMLEEYLLTGPLEITNDAYAIAKIAGLMLCKYFKKQYGANFISCMPTNLYGKNDNFNLETSHVLPALLRKFSCAHQEGAKEVVVWGTGTPRREFLFVDDLADAVVFLMQNYEGNDHINIGVGEDISILELALLIKKIVGFEGNIVFDSTKPDGTPRKLLNVDKLHELGWKAKTSLEQGIKQTYDWCLQNNAFAVQKESHSRSILN